MASLPAAAPPSAQLEPRRSPSASLSWLRERRGLLRRGAREKLPDKARLQAVVMSFRDLRSESNGARGRGRSDVACEVPSDPPLIYSII